MTNTPAFPTVMLDKPEGGMSLRDYFAAKTLPALIANFLAKELDEEDPLGWMEGLAMDAYSMADAMLKQRKSND
jgi:hypothetical protein